MNRDQDARGTQKSCSCGRIWNTLEQLLLDSEIKVLGFQPALVPGETESAYLFNHTACGNTLAISETAIRCGRLKS